MSSGVIPCDMPSTDMRSAFDSSRPVSPVKLPGHMRAVRASRFDCYWRMETGLLGPARP